MSSIAIVGLQWGDEGKGKIVDLLAESADAVVRFQGGHNAGHTLVVDGVTYKLSLLPSGAVRGRPGVIGNGVVLDPTALQREIAAVAAGGIVISPDNLKISDRSPLILSIHRDMDVMREHAAGGGKIGTTGRGIGPAYEDKVGRRAVRTGDLYDPTGWEARLDRLAAHHDPLRSGLGLPPIDRAVLVAELEAAAALLRPYVAPVHLWLHELRRAGKRILFEGAQGVLLDVDYGTYPYVTSSNTGAAQAATGSGTAPADYVLGVLKAYATRVGEGPFPSELNDAVGARIAERGREVGTVTGRARRCGAFDAVAAREAAILSGVHGLALTKLDVLDQEDELRICIGYRLPDGSQLDRLPADLGSACAVTPVYETLPGWQQNTRGAVSYGALPAAAIKYIRRIEELIGLPVDVLSTGPERNETVMLRSVW